MTSLLDHEKQGIGELNNLLSPGMAAAADLYEARSSLPVDIPKSEPALPKEGRQSVLVEAQGLVHGDRNKAYGSPLSDYTRTAGMVSAMLAHKLKEPLTAEDCAMIMCCVKLSRQSHKQKRDNMTDLAGYAECVQWMIDERAGKE
jgi:uncharacterized protein DUF6378